MLSCQQDDNQGLAYTQGLLPLEVNKWMSKGMQHYLLRAEE